MKFVWKITPYPFKIYESGEILFNTSGIYCIQPEGILFQTAAQVIEEGCRIAGLDYGTSNGTKVKFMPAETAPGGWEDYAQKPEGYVLSISQDMICLFASTPAGFLYGAITFKQILVQFGGEIPCCIIGDAPALPHRGVQLCLAQINVACRREYILDFIRRIAEMKYNAIYLYFEWFFQYPSLPFAGGPGSMSRDDIQIFQEECRKYGIQLIPAVNLLGHSGDLLDLQCFHHLAEYPAAHKDPRTLRGQNNFCIHQPRVCELIDNALNDLMDIFDSEIIHVGGDEVWEIGTCPHCREEVERHGAIALYARHFGRIREKLQERNRRMGIWGDMILMKLEPELFQKVYWKIQPDSFHIAPDVLAPLRGSIIYDWHYGRGSEETLTYFKDRGFDVVASTSTYGCYASTYWPAGSIYQKTLLGQACQLDLYGGLVTDWINVTGHHIEMVMPAVATGAVFMWSGNSTDYADKDSGKNMDPEMGPGIDADTITEAGTGEEKHNIQALEEAYALQRYHRELPGLIDFWHHMGDAKGPILKHFRKGPNGYLLRKFLYLTDNIMDFWHYMAFELTSQFAEYKEAVSRARVIWEQLEPELVATGDKYVGFLKAPLILHEQLVERFQLCEDLYALYDGAASAQYTCPGDYTRLLKEASERIRQFLPSMEPVIRLTREWHERLGLEKMAEHRIKLAVYKSKHLANYLEHLSNCKNGRPLPTFAFLHDVILDHSRSSISISRAHEWAQEPELFLHHDTMIYNEYGGVNGEIE